MPKNKTKSRAASAGDLPEPVCSYGVPCPPSVLSFAKTTRKNSNTKTDVHPVEVETSLVLPEPSLGEILQRTSGPDDVQREASPPRADSLAVLLEQGLRSDDKSILRSVLLRNDETLMRKTIDQLPLQYALPLIHYLGKMCAEERATPNKAPLQWLSLVLAIRSSYLTTLPDLAEQLRSIYVYADRRTKYTERFIRLHGVVASAVNLVKQRDYQKSELEAAKKKPVLTYNEPLDGADTDDEESDDEEEANTDEDMPTEESDNDTEGSENEDHSRKKINKRQQREEASEDESEEEHVKRKQPPSLSIADPDTDDE